MAVMWLLLLGFPVSSKTLAGWVGPENCRQAVQAHRGKVACCSQGEGTAQKFVWAEVTLGCSSSAYKAELMFLQG